MQRCLDIAKQGIAMAMPNPSVGAVLVYENKIIGEGYTSSYGGAHAEVNCIASVKAENQKYISKSTLYVSLEPCAHQGKTPACSLLILKHKIPQVVVASTDPNPLVAGKGIAMLQAKGVNVVTDVLAQKAMALNSRFYTFFTKKRPYIILKWAETPQGFFCPKDKKQFWISNSYSKQLVHQWRAEEMAILVGKNTALQDNPQLNVRLVSGKNPIRIVIDKKLELPNTLHLFDQSQNTLILNEQQNKTIGKIEWIAIDFSTEQLAKSILEVLYQRNIQSVIVEGGAKTLTHFIQQNLWDEARILVGKNELKDGIKVPFIAKKESESFTLKEDRIYLIKNNL